MKILISLPLLGLILFLIACSVLSYTSNLKNCEKAGGVYLSRDKVCAKADGFIKNYNQ